MTGSFLKLETAETFFFFFLPSNWERSTEEFGAYNLTAHFHKTCNTSTFKLFSLGKDEDVGKSLRTPRIQRRMLYHS